MKLFGEKHLQKYLSDKLESVAREVQFMNESEISRTSKEDLLAKLSKTAEIAPLKVNLENRTTKVTMTQVPAERFPRTYHVHPGKNYPCALVTYTYEMPSNPQLLECAPSGYIPKFNTDIAFAPKQMSIHYQTLYGNEILSDDIKKEVKNWIVSLHEEIENTVIEINDEIEKYNKIIPEKLETLVDAKYKSIEDRDKQNNDLNDF